MPQYIQREYSSTGSQDTTGIYILIVVCSLVAIISLGVVIYNWCKNVAKKDRDRERKELQEAREFAHRFMSKKQIELPKTNLKKKLEFVF